MPFPLSSYKNWVGVKPVLITGVLKTAVAKTGTSLKVATGTGTPATTDTVVILDGENTESFAVHAWTSTTKKVTLTTSTKFAHAHAQGTYVFFLLTSGFGPANYVPLDTFKVPDKYSQIYDKSRVGSLVVERGAVQGMRTSEWSLSGDVFPDTFGYVLASIFGTEVYTAGATTTPHTHAFSVDNTGNGQPVKHAWFVYDGVNCRVVVGRITKVGIKYAGGKDTPVSFDATLMARASGVVATPTVSFSTVKLLAAWRASLAIATAYNRTPLSFTVTLTREEAENIPTMNGTQDPLDSFVGALRCTVKGTLVKKTDTQLDVYFAGTTQKFVLTIAPFAATLAAGTGLVFQSSVANYDQVEPVLQGKGYNTEDFAFTCIGNTTDHGTSGGLSPCKVSLKNAIATDVYLG